MKIKNVLIKLLLLVLLLCGCIKEDLDVCPPGERLICFESVMDKYNFEDIVDNTTLYLYNFEGELVFNRLYAVEDLTGNNYMVAIPLQKPGKYTLLASMNSGNDYRKTESFYLPDFNISLIPDNVDTVFRKQHDIYHGFREIVFGGTEEKERGCDRVSLYKNTNHIYITMGFEGYNIPEDYTFFTWIEADNGAYGYTNVNLENVNRVYRAHNEKPMPDSHYYDFTVMHVKERNTISLLLEERDEKGIAHTSQKKDLVKEIMKIYRTDEELDQEDVFDIKIILGEGMNIISLVVNGWYTIKDGVDI